MNLTENVLMIFRKIANALEKRNQIDWEQRRYEIASSLLGRMNQFQEPITCDEAISLADKLIEELKKKDND